MKTMSQMMMARVTKKACKKMKRMKKLMLGTMNLDTWKTTRHSSTISIKTISINSSNRLWHHRHYQKKKVMSSWMIEHMETITLKKTKGTIRLAINLKENITGHSVSLQGR